MIFYIIICLLIAHYMFTSKGLLNDIFVRHRHGYHWMREVYMFSYKPPPQSKFKLKNPSYLLNPFKYLADPVTKILCRNVGLNVKNKQGKGWVI